MAGRVSETKWNAQLQETGPGYNLDFAAQRWTLVTITRNAATLVDIERHSNNAHPQRYKTVLWSANLRPVAPLEPPNRAEFR
jgi:hypothetical protein